jgi:endonuclease/exonuclease/phosphatase (EEP) superfamily protein YafD
MLRRFSRAAAYTCIGVAVLAICVRATAQDTWPLSAWIFYFVPPPVITLLLLAATILLAVIAASGAAVVCLATATLVYAQWHFSQEFHRPCAAVDGGVRVLAWNVARGRAGWDAIAEYAAQTNADVIGLVEGGDPSEQRLQFWRERFEGYTALLPGGGLVLLVRGDVESSRFQQLVGISSALVADLEIGGKKLRLVLADLDASPRFDKRRLTESLLGLADTRNGAPVVLMGDFNMPTDSRWFRPLRESFTHAFEQAGSGRLATWPAETPLVALDHVWVSRGFRPACAVLVSTGLSDHRAFLTDLAYEPAVGAPLL